jgi:hypothetical protein
MNEKTSGLLSLFFFIPPPSSLIPSLTLHAGKKSDTICLAQHNRGTLKLRTFACDDFI